MSLTPWLPTIRKIKDGEKVEQAVINVPLEQLTQRDQHLYEKFQELVGKSSLISYGNPVHSTEVLSVGELNAVYFKKAASLQEKAGLAKASTGFTSSSYSSVFSPKDSNFIFGIVKNIYSDGSTFSADVFTEGLCNFDVDIDDSTYGLIQKTSGVVESFSVGPYYLSTKVPGKITRDPSGIPVYVGYAISKRQLLLHTSVDEFSQFFINYRFHVLDRVAGNPVLTAGVWSITNPDNSKLGWLPVSALDFDPPEGASFYYNIPDAQTVLSDVGLEDFEKEESSELLKFLPPVPSNFAQLYVNGILWRYQDEFDTSGYYSINEYGLWWYSAEEGQQPWADNYPSNKAPAVWTSEIKPLLAEYRKNIFISFSKFNPALRTQLVSSLKGFNTSTDKSYKFLKFFGRDNITQESTAGDLLFSIEAPTSYYGYKTNYTTSDINLLTDDFVYPPNRSASFSSDRAVAAIKYSKEDGVFKAALTPIVSKLTGTGAINVSHVGNGIWNIAYLTQGLTGFIDSIEPINARLEFRGLNSYIKLPVPSNTPYGFIGKIILPQGYPSNKDINLSFHLFGDQTSSATTVAFDFEYSVIPAYRISFTSQATSEVTLSPTYTAPTPIEFDLSDSTYTAYISKKIASTNIKINAASLHTDSAISFKITRVTPTVAAEADRYPGNVGILATYWEII